MGLANDRGVPRDFFFEPVVKPQRVAVGRWRKVQVGRVAGDNTHRERFAFGREQVVRQEMYDVELADGKAARGIHDEVNAGNERLAINADAHSVRERVHREREWLEALVLQFAQPEAIELLCDPIRRELIAFQHVPAAMHVRARKGVHIAACFLLHGRERLRDRTGQERETGEKCGDGAEHAGGQWFVPWAI